MELVHLILQVFVTDFTTFPSPLPRTDGNFQYSLVSYHSSTGYSPLQLLTCRDRVVNLVPSVISVIVPHVSTPLLFYCHILCFTFIYIMPLDVIKTQ
jgi:hypothetical protein